MTKHITRRYGRCSTMARLAAGVVLLCGFTGVRGAAYVQENQLWPGGVVPFEFDPDMDFFTRVRVEIAFDIWEQLANVTFVPRSNEEEDYIYVRNTPGGGGSSSDVGRQGGQQFLNIRADLSGVSDHGLAHEVGHLLGFHHNFVRPDRDNYITWYEERTNDCGKGNYEIVDDALAYPRNAMDFDSLMGYGQCIFEICNRIEDEDCACGEDGCQRYSFAGCTTDCCDQPEFVCCPEDPVNCRVLEIVDPGLRSTWQTVMGQRDHVSDIDALVMSWMYPEPGTRFLELNYSPSDETGTFHHPYVTVDSALERAPDSILLLAQPATYPRPTSIMRKPMVIRPATGSVLIR